MLNIELWTREEYEKEFGSLGTNVKYVLSPIAPLDEDPYVFMGLVYNDGHTEICGGRRDETVGLITMLDDLHVR